LIHKYSTSLIGKEQDKNAENIELFLSWLGNRIAGMSEEERSLHEDDVKNKLIEKLMNSVKDGYFYKDYEEGKDSKENKNETADNYVKFIELLAQAKENSGEQYDTINIFTPNYDLFIENALDESGYSYTDRFKSGLNNEFKVSEYGHRPVDVMHRYRDRWSAVSPFFRVYKLHGSLNWMRKNNSIEKRFIESRNDLDNNDDMLIAPTSSKYADTQGAPFSDLFRELSIELMKPNSVLVVNGYGFGDEHINNFIIQALGRKDFMLIAFVDGANPSTALKNFMDKVKANSGATFIYDNRGLEKKDTFPLAFFFSTLIDFVDFNVSVSNNEEENE